MTTRDRLLDTAKSLIWERGVQATSPNDLLEASGIGQVSLYHYFHGKNEWAGAAIAALAEDLDRETRALLTAERASGRDRVLGYLSKPRTALAGCRWGRLAFDHAVAGSAEVAAPISAYAASAHEALVSALSEAQQDGDLRDDLDPGTLASTIAATVQGGYVLARMSGQENAMDDAVAGLVALLEVAGASTTGARLEPRLPQAPRERP